MRKSLRRVFSVFVFIIMTIGFVVIAKDAYVMINDKYVSYIFIAGIVFFILVIAVCLIYFDVYNILKEDFHSWVSVRELTIFFIFEIFVGLVCIATGYLLFDSVQNEIKSDMVIGVTSLYVIFGLSSLIAGLYDGFKMYLKISRKA